MINYFKGKNEPITADMAIYSSDDLSVAEMRELDKMNADDLVVYAEAVPSWDYIEEGMWAYIVQQKGLDVDEDPNNWIPDDILATAKGEISAVEPEYDDDGNFTKTVFSFDPDADGAEYRIDFDSIDIGTPVLVVRHENILTGKRWYSLLSDDRSVNRGYPGNADPSFCTFHGWRGTTNDISVSAEGVHVITGITLNKSGLVEVTISPEDIKADED